MKADLFTGQTIELISRDDRFEPRLAAGNARQLITEYNVSALKV